MDIKQSRRLLAVGVPDSGVLDVIKDLAGSAPAPDNNGSTAGLTHEWNVETAYYSARVPIWVDEITDIEAWKAEFMKPEAKEVVEAVCAWLYCFRIPSNGQPSADVEAVIESIQNISEEHIGYGADVIMLAVGMPPKAGSDSDSTAQLKHEQWDDLCIQYNFEYINYGATGSNDFGEKVGFARLKEALEASKWTAAASSPSTSELDFDSIILDEEDIAQGFAREEAEMTAELFGMKAALTGQDGAEDYEPDAEDIRRRDRSASQVEDLDRLMGKLLAVKEQSAELPEAQRKKLAAKAVRELMGDIGGDENG